MLNSEASDQESTQNRSHRASDLSEQAIPQSKPRLKEAETGRPVRELESGSALQISASSSEVAAALTTAAMRMASWT